MKKKRLGVNIDHVATIRNARGETYPDPLKAALVAQQSGADSVTIHLREDRRHIRDYDLKNIKHKLKIPLNLEIAPTKKMLDIAVKNKPNFVCIVPEKRKEITTEGGLNIKKNKLKIKEAVKKLKRNKIRVSLFIEPNIMDIDLAKLSGADCVELHTGKFCNVYNKKKNTKIIFSNIKKAADYAKKLGLDVHAGHGLTYESAKKISKINSISELNIGHFLISESLFLGLSNAIKKIIMVLNIK
ncbi:pyridoxine 5'-phosphate synthase [Pelagibacteraceae bacterium]|jgi:pyridoxine 5-phosphate synthase|nr:pyridoxine 5'-phosphate synthase [Pelagibacteraceae bacterium]